MNQPGQWIRLRRKSLGLLQKDLAHRAGVSTSYISTLERGQAHSITGAQLRPEPAVVEAIARALRSDPDELLLLYGYAPSVLVRKPQSLAELLDIFSSWGIEHIEFAEKEALINASPDQLKDVLDAVEIAVSLALKKYESQER